MKITSIKKQKILGHQTVVVEVKNNKSKTWGELKALLKKKGVL